MSFQTQSESTECGFACITIALGKLGAPAVLSELRRKQVILARGLTYGAEIVGRIKTFLESRP